MGRRNYKLQRGTETIGGNKTIKMKAGKMLSSIKMCRSKLWGWAAEEAVSLGGESEGRGGSSRSNWHGTHGEGIVCVGKLGCERDLGHRNL